MALRPELRQTFLDQKEQQKLQHTKEQINEQKQRLTHQKIRAQKSELSVSKVKELRPENKEEKHHVEQSRLLEQLLKPEHQNERINPELLKKRKRKRHYLHL